MDVFAGLLAALGAPSDPIPVIIEEKVDTVEVNHYFDDRGNKVFDQVVYYNWSQEYNRFTACGYRLIKQDTQVPVMATPSIYHSIWSDGDCLRDLNAAVAVETWSQWDPELAERNYLPKSMRSEFAIPSPLSTQPPAVAVPKTAARESNRR